MVAKACGARFRVDPSPKDSRQRVKECSSESVYGAFGVAWCCCCGGCGGWHANLPSHPCCVRREKPVVARRVWTSPKIRSIAERVGRCAVQRSDVTRACVCCVALLGRKIAQGLVWISWRATSIAGRAQKPVQRASVVSWVGVFQHVRRICLIFVRGRAWINARIASIVGRVVRSVRWVGSVKKADAAVLSVNSCVGVLVSIR